MHVLTSQKSQIVSSPTPLNLTGNFNSSFYLEFWVKIREDPGRQVLNAVETEIVKIQGVVAVRVRRDLIELQIGNEVIWRDGLR